MSLSWNQTIFHPSGTTHAQTTKLRHLKQRGKRALTLNQIKNMKWLSQGGYSVSSEDSKKLRGLLNKKLAEGAGTIIQ